MPFGDCMYSIHQGQNPDTVICNLESVNWESQLVAKVLPDGPEQILISDYQKDFLGVISNESWCVAVVGGTTNVVVIKITNLEEGVHQVLNVSSSPFRKNRVATVDGQGFLFLEIEGTLKFVTFESLIQGNPETTILGNFPSPDYLFFDSKKQRIYIVVGEQKKLVSFQLKNLKLSLFKSSNLSKILRMTNIGKISTSKTADFKITRVRFLSPYVILSVGVQHSQPSNLLYLVLLHERTLMPTTAEVIKRDQFYDALEVITYKHCRLIALTDFASHKIFCLHRGQFISIFEKNYFKDLVEEYQEEEEEEDLRTTTIFWHEQSRRLHFFAIDREMYFQLD